MILIAAKHTGRLGYLLELNPLDVDVIVRRWEACTGKQAVHSETGLIFEALRNKRALLPAARRPKRRCSRRWMRDMAKDYEVDTADRRMTALWPRLYRPLFDKSARLSARAPKFEAGTVLLPREAPWLAAYLSELLAFPSGATTIRWTTRRRSTHLPDTSQQWSRGTDRTRSGRKVSPLKKITAIHYRVCPTAQ